MAQRPNSAGISRHWTLDRNRQITPSNCSHNRSGQGPYLPTGSYGSMNFHWALVSCLRVTATVLSDFAPENGTEPKNGHDITQALSPASG